MSIAPTAVGSRRGSGRGQLLEEVAGYVRERILTGALKSGEFLRMDPIADAMGVSITPVREALVMLTSEGFVTSLPHRGFVVAEITRDDVRDIFWTQSKLAGELAARAAKRITEAEVQNLEAIHEECDKAIRRGDIAEAGHQRQLFLRAINVAARSARIHKMLGLAVRQLPALYYLSLEAHADESAPAHSQILEAIKAHDPKRARSLTEKHRLNAANTVIALMEERGFWSDPSA